MPVIRGTNRHSAPRSNGIDLATMLELRLTDELLGKHGRPGGPLVFEIEIDATDELLVYVIWDAWEAMPASQRSNTIDAAYGRRASLVLNTYRVIGPEGIPGQPAVPPRVRIGVGVTWDEALAMGMLPFGVVAREGSSVPPDQLRAYLLSEGGKEGPEGIRLYYPDEAFALQAKDRLALAVPEVHWEIIRLQATAPC